MAGRPCPAFLWPHHSPVTLTSFPQPGTALAPHLASFTPARPALLSPPRVRSQLFARCCVLTHRSPLRCPLWKAAFSIFSRGPYTFSSLPNFSLLSQSYQLSWVTLTTLSSLPGERSLSLSSVLLLQDPTYVLPTEEDSSKHVSKELIFERQKQTQKG